MWIRLCVLEFCFGIYTNRAVIYVLVDVFPCSRSSLSFERLADTKFPFTGVQLILVFICPRAMSDISLRLLRVFGAAGAATGPAAAAWSASGAGCIL